MTIYQPVPDEAIEEGAALHVVHPWRWSQYASGLLSDRGPCVSHALRRSGLAIDTSVPSTTPEIVTPVVSSVLPGQQRLCWPMLVWQSGPHETLRVDLRASGTGRVSLWADGRESPPVDVDGEDTYRLEVRAPRRRGWSIAAVVFESRLVEDVELGVSVDVVDPYTLRRGSGAPTSTQHAILGIAESGTTHICGAYTTGLPADADLTIWPPTDLTGTIEVSVIAASSLSLLGVAVRLLGERDVEGPRIGTPTRARTPAGAVQVHTERYVQSVDLVSCVTCEPTRIGPVGAGDISRTCQTITRQSRVGRCDGDGSGDRVAHEFAALLYAVSPVVGSYRGSVLIGTDSDQVVRGVTPIVPPPTAHVRVAAERGWGHSSWGGLDLPTVRDLSLMGVETITVETDDADDDGPALCVLDLVDGSSDPIGDARFVALGVAVRRS